MCVLWYILIYLFINNNFFVPTGKFCGGLGDMKASDLGSIVIKEALDRAKIPPKDVSEVILGQVNIDKYFVCIDLYTSFIANTGVHVKRKLATTV